MAPLKFFLASLIKPVLFNVFNMGSSWSREKPVDTVQEVRPAAVEKTGSKRSLDPEEQTPSTRLKKNRYTQSKKKGKKDNKEQKKERGEGKGFQTRPESLGPKEPRIPKKKVALMVGFNGTGYQGMQL